MKKALLLTASLVSGLCFGQSLDQSNEPVIGETTNFFLCDSNVTNYDNVTGSSAVWDYSDILGVPGIQKLASVIDPSSSPFASNYPSSQKAIAIESSVTTFYTSTSSERSSQGFVFSEPTFGDVKVVFDTDEEKTHNYPMGLGTTLTDDFDGELNFTFQSIPQTTSCSGSIYAWVDGQGTLELPGNTYNDVIRYKMIDSAFTTVVLLGNIEVIRTQYEYYDFTVSNLPIFIHANIKVQSVGSSSPLTNQTLVLCKDEPLGWLGLNNASKSTFAVYPNPTTGEFSIHGFDGLADVTIIDQSGRVLKSWKGLNPQTKVDVSDMNSGTYFVNISSGETTSVEKVTIK
jgi:hypothetical protein